MAMCVTFISMNTNTLIATVVIVVLLLVSLALNAFSLYKVSSIEKTLGEGKELITTLKTELAALKKSGAAPARRQQQPEEPKIVRVSIDDDPMKGDPNAPVTMIEFSDYQCPYCRRFHNNVLPLLEKNYINTGKVRYVFRDKPLGFHPLAMPAAVVANCAGKQGKYWEMNDFLFKNPANLQETAMLVYVKELGLDYDKFKECRKDKRQEQEVRNDFQDSETYGVRGTPSFFIGKTTGGKMMDGLYLRGARPYAAYKTTIDKLLSE